jgi:hypothetical protein
MKRNTLIKIIILATALFLLFGCEDPGVTSKRLTGAEDNLPFELRGLKVYSVSLGEGDWVKVAVLNGQPNSLTYAVGKTTETTIIVNQNNRSERVIHGSIISENDSIIVIKK